MNFGQVFKSFSGGMQGSPMSRMDNQQRLQALGSAFSGDQDQLAQIMGSLNAPGRPQRPHQEGPVVNEEGDDISAAFGGGGGGSSMGLLNPKAIGQFGLLGPMLMKGGGMGLLGGLLGGFGKKKGG